MVVPSTNGNGKTLLSQQSVNAAVKSICDIMRRSNCAGALQYVPELTWILFLRILDERELQEKEEAEAVSADFSPSLESPYRWQDWAAPHGTKRRQLQNSTLNAFLGFLKDSAAMLNQSHSSFVLPQAVLQRDFALFYFTNNICEFFYRFFEAQFTEVIFFLLFCHFLTSTFIFFTFLLLYFQ